MGFLNWFSNQESEQSEESQLSLFEKPGAIRQRADGLQVRKEFTRKIQDNGGDNLTQATSTEAMTREIFGCSSEELYQGTNGQRGKRETLPSDAQNAFIVGEVVAGHRLDELETKGNKQQKHRQIVDTVTEASRDVKPLFPWNRRKE